jgi:hypothetical protein
MCYKNADLRWSGSDPETSNAHIFLTCYDHQNYRRLASSGSASGLKMKLFNALALSVLLLSLCSSALAGQCYGCMTEMAEAAETSEEAAQRAEEDVAEAQLHLSNVVDEIARAWSNHPWKIDTMKKILNDHILDTASFTSAEQGRFFTLPAR